MTAEKRTVLDFETFKRTYNNFYLYFIDNEFGAMYRSADFYQHCIETSKEFRDVSYVLSSRNDFLSDEYLRLLFNAYIIMRQYVDDDWTIFR